MSSLTELEQKLVDALQHIADSTAATWVQDYAKAAIALAEAKAKEPQSGCACDLQEVAKAQGQEAKVEPPCSEFIPLDAAEEFCAFCEHSRACHLGSQG